VGNYFLTGPKLRRLLFLAIVLILFPLVAIGTEEEVKLDKAHIDLTDLPSLQRGAKLFMNYCAGCHSLKYVRYNEMAKGTGIVDSSGKVLEAALKKNLIFSDAKSTDPILTSMHPEDGANWFGVIPPDLSLEARLRGANWLYTYLRSFYPDEKRPWGVNNHVFPDVAMPNVLLSLQKNTPKEEYDRMILDLVNFLVYVSEPHQQARQHLGVWVLMFLGIFFVFTWLLKREYWKDVH